MEKTTKIGAVTSVSVKKHTNKNWDTWLSELNKLGCRNLSHQDLVKLLKTKFKLTVWWQQEVARGYQIGIGKRIANQTLKGTYTTTATKSFTASAHAIYKFLVSSAGQNIWLKPMYPISIKASANFECEDGIFGEFRTVTAYKKLRLTWIDDEWPNKTVVQINLYKKPNAKCMVVIDHIDLPSLKAKNEMHSRWRKAVDEIAEALTPS